MIEVLPAIMPKSFDDLAEKAGMAVSYASRVQLDIMDGRFVPEKTWPCFSAADADFAAILSEDRGLPEWERLEYEIDLMTETPEADAFDWIKAGAGRLVLHFESTEELGKLVGELRAEFGKPGEGAFSPELGIAANNDTALSEWEPIVPLFDFVQVMGIARIGYQGESFDERALHRLRELRQKFPSLPLSVDGAVSDETAPSLVAAGATRLVSGSYLFGSDNPRRSFETLSKLS